MTQNLYRWSQKSIVGILDRREYTGCTVNFKTYTKSLKFKKRMENPKENQRFFEGTQPAFIEMGQMYKIPLKMGDFFILSPKFYSIVLMWLNLFLTHCVPLSFIRLV